MNMTRTGARTKRNRLATGCLLAVLALLVGAGPAQADRPTVEGPLLEVFDDVNPCTGLVHTVTISVTFSAHFHGDRQVVTGDSTLSTSSGFSGQGRSSFVGNGQVERFQLLDMLTNESGDRIQARAIFVFDVSTGTARVDSFDLVCVGS
jgi:hypothetical protein